MGNLTDVARSLGSCVGLGPLRKWVQETSQVLDQANVPRLTPGLWNCPTTVQVSDAVFVTGTDSVDRARADSIITMPAVGFVLSKPSPTLALVVYAGELDTFAGLLPGGANVYYVSPLQAGRITTNPPTPGQYKQQAGLAKDPKTLVVNLTWFGLVSGI